VNTEREAKSSVKQPWGVISPFIG